MDAPKEVTLVVNPVAGGGVSARSANDVLRALRSLGLQVRPVRPTSAEATRRFVASVDSGGVVVALGGDGFMRWVAAGCLESGAVMAPLPGGRGNDLCRYLGVPLEPVEAALALEHATKRKVDVGCANGEVFLGMASMGWDTWANRYANEFTSFGPLAYVAGAIKAAITYRPTRFMLRTPGPQASIQSALDSSQEAAEVSEERVAWLLDVGNTGRYGGGLIMCPKASITDGILDIVSIGPVGRVPFFKLVLQAFKGTHVEHSAVSETFVRRVHIASDKPTEVWADGDHITDLPASIEVKHGALEILA
ncbi:MAG: diacylglycerol kinase family protein [Actinomycetaceae bacterium]|nr:diacylglycerol kinase family protein [Actinomycetaceae bacterium]